MTREEKLLRAIGDIDDELILAADDSVHRVVPFPRKTPWKKVAVTAACFLLIAGVWFSVDDLFRMGKSTGAVLPQSSETSAAPAEIPDLKLDEDQSEPEEGTMETAPEDSRENAAMEEQKYQSNVSGTPLEENPATGGFGGGSETGDYLAYYLPLQPLSICGETDSVSVEREVTVDAIDYSFASSEEKIHIMEVYSLTNSGSQPATVELQYLYGEYLNNPNQVTMTVDGSAEGQSVKAGKGAAFDSGNRVIYDFGSFTEFFSDDAYNMPNIPYIENATIYRIHDVNTGTGNNNRKSIQVEFTAPKTVPVFFENLYGTISDEGNSYRYQVDSSLNFDEWKIIVCGDVKPDFEIDFIERKNDETVFLKADYEMDVTEVSLDKLLEQEIRSDEMWTENNIAMDVLVSACRETLYNNYIFNNRTETTELYYLVQDALMAQRYLSVNQTVTIPAKGSITVEIQTEKALNQWYQDSARGLELLNDETMATTVIVLPPNRGETLESNIPQNGVLDPREEYYYINMGLSLCDGVPLKE